MKIRHIMPALFAGALLCACSSQEKKAAESAAADTVNLTEEQNAAIEETVEAAALPYKAEFFLDDANKGLPGDSAKWTATDSGIRYTVIKQGTGAKPSSPEAVVTVHYAGELTDGTPFDSSYGRGEPASFGLDHVIKGWTEGLQLMPVGSVYEFYIPAALAYGEQGAGGQIPPNAPLLFKVELLEAK